jgi:hypothetical protein
MSENDPFDGDPFASALGSNDEPEQSGTRAPMKRGRYVLPAGKNGKDAYFTRATNFAKAIADTYLLSLWSQRMTLKGAALRPDLLALASSLDVKADREDMNDLVEQAKTAAGASARANLGTALHAFTERYDRGEDPKVPAPWDDDLAAYAAGLTDLGIVIEPDMIERTVLCDRYGIAGTFDRLARTTRDLYVRLPSRSEPVHIPAGTLLVFDLKTGDRLDFGMQEFAVQLALYANSETVYDPATRSMVPMPADVSKDVAIVCHLPVGQAQVEFHAVDIAAGWQTCELIREARAWRKTSVSTVIEFVKVGEPDPSEILLAEIEKAETVLGLAEIRNRAVIDKTWTPVVEKKALERRDAILARVVSAV